jgi:cytochrome c-type biogenesis protein CcsB
MALVFFGISLVFYLAATIGFVGHLVLGREELRRWGTAALWIGLGADTFGLALRVITLGTSVLNSFDDQLSLLAWLIVGVYLALQTRYHLAVLGALVSPLAFLLTLSSYVVFSGAQTLPERLQDAWLPAHIAPAFFGYALFAFAACLSLVYLLQERQLKAKRRHVFRRMPSLETLDDLTYRCVAWGFGLFTIGIVTGSLLAKARWGAFWSWEPVQILSVLAWLLYAVLLQTRSVGWRGRRAATLTIVGFALLIVSFLTLNLGVAPHGRALG